MKAYFELIQDHPEPWEVQVICKLDQLMLENYAKQAALDSKK